MGVACGARLVGFMDACAAWFNSGYMFYRKLWTNFSIFYVAVNSNPVAFGLHSCRMEKRAQSMLLVAVSLSLRVLHFLAVCGGFLLLSAAGALDDEEFFVIEGSM